MSVKIKELIQENLTVNGYKKVNTSELDNLVRQSLGVGQYFVQGGYVAFGTALQELVEEDILQPVKKAGTNGRMPLLYNRYHVCLPGEEIDSAGLLTYHPKIKIDRYIKAPAIYRSHLPFLKQLDKFLKTADTAKTLAQGFSVNERSYQIFNDEKFLASARGKEFCNFIGIDFSDLGCYPTYEPFFYSAYPVMPANDVLIVENKDTFFTIKKIFQQYGSIINKNRFCLLIYGEGKKILRSLRFIEEIPQIQAANCRFIYFGDLDYEGINILGSLAKSYQEFRIKPFVYLYRLMLDFPARQMTKKQQLNFGHLDFFLSFYEERDKEIIKSVLDGELCIPQEALAYPILLRECVR